MTDKPELKPCPFCGGEPYWADSNQWIEHRSDCYFKLGEALRDRRGPDRWNQRADLAKPSEWISVDDRLPERGQLVLVHTPNQKPRMMDGEFVKLSTDATHWQPLPSPPIRETP